MNLPEYKQVYDAVSNNKPIGNVYKTRLTYFDVAFGFVRHIFWYKVYCFLLPLLGDFTDWPRICALAAMLGMHHCFNWLISVAAGVQLLNVMDNTNMYELSTNKDHIICGVHTGKFRDPEPLAKHFASCFTK